ncbi:hypothetical protein K458DRAFT_390935 [Lentithecium fluviatile CBS 122367]|uniref:Uncharacterized protein n=1 Tax=Lentithecium fluviatile CBS 122367 TaxID=1168545 RepID=A0A6G1IW19_9PLEO|nr:hypothetical protein K458DRAFT_390935 [Lentithecium fluviatile CBS 122367]
MKLAAKPDVAAVAGRGQLWQTGSVQEEAAGVDSNGAVLWRRRGVAQEEQRRGGEKKVGSAGAVQCAVRCGGQAVQQHISWRADSRRFKKGVSVSQSPSWWAEMGAGVPCMDGLVADPRARQEGNCVAERQRAGGRWFGRVQHSVGMESTKWRFNQLTGKTTSRGEGSARAALEPIASGADAQN